MEKQKTDKLNTPCYWLNKNDVDKKLECVWSKNWLLSFRDVTGSSSERTAIFSILPRVAVGNNAPLIFLNSKHISLITCLYANLCSITFDFVARQKVGGAHMNFFIVKQLPVLPSDRYSQNDINYITPRVLELTYTAWDIKPFADDLWAGDKSPVPQTSVAIGKAQLDIDLGIGTKQLELSSQPETSEITQRLRELILAQWQANQNDSGLEGIIDNPQMKIKDDTIPIPPFIWNETRRANLRAELDAYYAHLYGLTRDELRYILDPADVYGADFPSETFRVLKNNEIKKHGEYRTQRLVLEAWDKLGY